MKCPKCGKAPTVEHFRNFPECGPVVATVCARYRLSKRVTPPKPGTGRPPILRACPSCGFEGNTTQVRAHKCEKK
jgi:hypothetical protein